MSKQQGAKRTTDFGACRDLSGRRLRHVNDEQILLRWKAAKEKVPNHHHRCRIAMLGMN